MNRSVLYIINLLLAVLLWTACENETGTDPQPSGNGSDTYLSLRIATKSGDEDQRSDDEKKKEDMNNLRVIILSKNGIIEYNEFINFGTSKQEHIVVGTDASDLTQWIKVKANEDKTVYLIANMKDTDFTGEVGENGKNLSENIDNYIFPKDINGDIGYLNGADQLIPITAKYTIHVGTAKFQEFGPLYVVRAATKFTLSYTNNRSNAVTIKSWSISNVADRAYLMPHVNRTEDDKYTAYDNGYYGNGWIGWISKNLNSNRSDYVTEYEVPKTSSHVSSYKISYTDCKLNANGGSKVASPVYLHESRYLVKNENENENIEVQQYMMTFEFQEENEKVETYNVPFVVSESLFRDLHAYINVTINEDEAPIIYAGIVYWQWIDFISRDLIPSQPFVPNSNQ